jgi:hypothetical protein
LRARRPAVLLALGALGLAAAGVLVWIRMAADDAALRAGPAPASASAPPRPAAVEPVAAGGPRTQAPSPVPAGEPSLQAQIDRLLATHDPRDAYRAYRLVADCAAFNANGDRIIFDEQELARPKRDALPGFRAMSEGEKRHDTQLCAGMTERERQNRLDYLAIAARAGVPGAAVDFAGEGPFGDKSALATRPDDPLVKEWKATARAQLSQAAESGTDSGALQVMASDSLNGIDFNDGKVALTYRYRLAWGLIESDLIGPDNPISKIYAAGSDLMNNTGADLTPQQRADELEAAQAIAERARAARKRAHGGG